jgi:hypothetical protein
MSHEHEVITEPMSISLSSHALIAPQRKAGLASALGMFEELSEVTKLGGLQMRVTSQVTHGNHVAPPGHRNPLCASEPCRKAWEA